MRQRPILPFSDSPFCFARVIGKISEHHGIYSIELTKINRVVKEPHEIYHHKTKVMVESLVHEHGPPVSIDEFTDFHTLYSRYEGSCSSGSCNTGSQSEFSTSEDCHLDLYELVLPLHLTTRIQRNDCLLPSIFLHEHLHLRCPRHPGMLQLLCLASRNPQIR